MRRQSERRTERLLGDFLNSQGWDERKPPLGNLYIQNEYRDAPDLFDALSTASKSGRAYGVPEAVLVDTESRMPLAVIEAKANITAIGDAVEEARSYGSALLSAGFCPVAIGIAGTDESEFDLQVWKWTGENWSPVTYDGHPINWIPNQTDLRLLTVAGGPTEVRPTIPPIEVLAQRADEINRLLREARIKDEYRPAVVAATMLALWHSKGAIRRDQRYILRDINDSCRDAYLKAGKPELAQSVRVDEENDALKQKVRRIAVILERLNVTVLTAEHDYLGQLYETFFRYTGGNSIGQYFTPRHIARLMVDVCEVSERDIVLDPACGSGGFLVACMDRILRETRASRTQMVDIVKAHLLGFEDEPITAALCVANMIFRGDGSTGITKADCLTSREFPSDTASVGLMNPPFPHKKTDTPIEAFVDKALEGLKARGKLAVIMPTGLLVKSSTWRDSLLEKHTLHAVCQLPDELFQPFASATTSFVLLEKGVPHNPQRKTTFVRLVYDGFSLHKNIRVERGLDQTPQVLDILLNSSDEPGFSGTAHIHPGMEWGAGAYIKPAEQTEDELKQAVDVLVRRLAAFYTRYAPEIVGQRQAIERGEIEQVSYRDIVSSMKRRNAMDISGASNEVGGNFDMYYGLSEIESRKDIPPGKTLIISPREGYNGCYGWLEFHTVLRPPFITVARTGSIGEAFVQLEPCAPNSDCLVLLPRHAMAVSELFLVASAIRGERWRYNYGRKITPERLAPVRIPAATVLQDYAADLCKRYEVVIASSLAPVEGKGSSEFRAGGGFGE